MPMKWLEHFCDDRRDQDLSSIRIWTIFKRNQTFYYLFIVYCSYFTRYISKQVIIIHDLFDMKMHIPYLIFTNILYELGQNKQCSRNWNTMIQKVRARNKKKTKQGPRNRGGGGGRPHYSRSTTDLVTEFWEGATIST